MRLKKALNTSFIALLLITLAFMGTRSKTQQPSASSQTATQESTSLEATMHVDPSTTTAKVHQKFSVNIIISNVTDLYGWEFKLKWDSTLLEALNITEGDFLKSHNDTFFVININNTQGYIRVVCTLIGSIPGVNGTGILAIVEFEAENAWECPLDLYDTKLVNSSEQSINHTATDGQVKILSDDILLGGRADRKLLK